MNENSKKDGGATESRSFERIPVVYEINLMVGLYGFDPQDHRFEAHGRTINISRSGVLVKVLRPVAVSSRCLIHFEEGEEVVGRTLVYGIVRRVNEVEDEFQVGIEFDNPLDFIRVSDEPSDEH